MDSIMIKVHHPNVWPVLQVVPNAPIQPQSPAPFAVLATTWSDLLAPPACQSAPFAQAVQLAPHAFLETHFPQATLANVQPISI